MFSFSINSHKKKKKKLRKPNIINAIHFIKIILNYKVLKKKKIKNKCNLRKMIVIFDFQIFSKFNLLSLINNFSGIPEKIKYCLKLKS